MNLCLRSAALAVSPRDASELPPVPQDSTIRGRAEELHRQLSHLREPVTVPRDQCVVNLNFSNESSLETVPESGSPVGPSQPSATANKGRATNQQSALGDLLHDGALAFAGLSLPLEPSAASAGRRPTRHGQHGDLPNDGEAGPTLFQPRISASGAQTSGLVPSRRSTATGGQAPWEDGEGHKGFVKVKSMKAPQGLEWSHSRRCLEVLLVQEQSIRGGTQGGGGGAGGPLMTRGFKGHEQRLRERLERLNLDMLIVAGDGNCQFRSISNELYGTQDHHAAIRRRAVSYIASHREDFECFLGEDFDHYCRNMTASGTWGDELTLRAVSDSFGIVVRVVTSDLENWYLTYEPQCCKMDREIFLTYIAPIHYNSIRRQSSLKTMALHVSRSFQRLSSMGSNGGGLGSRTTSGVPSGPLELLGAGGAEAGRAGQGGQGTPVLV